MTITLTREKAQQVLDAMTKISQKTCKVMSGKEFDRLCDAVETLRTRLSAPEPEPVAWARNLTDPQPHCVTDLKYCSVAQMDRGDHLKYIPLYTAPPQRERIVYCGCGDGIVPDDGAECGTCVSMRQREWQGLTDEDFDWCEEHSHGNTERTKGKAFARAIEAKLKEKNT